LEAVRGVVLDYGEVLCGRPDETQLARFAQALGLGIETLAARYQQHRGPYDRGDISPVEYWSRVMAGNGELTDALLGELRDWDVQMWSNIDPAMIEWLGRLSEAGLKTAVLSNMHQDMAAYARQNFPWLRRLDSLILSCEVRLVKPERAIYDLCVKGIAIRPAEVLFIDDREVNVLAAREAGLAALRFESSEQLAEVLAERHFPVLPITEPVSRSHDSA
jgi:putative hydrolase of the HAD superfamily